MRLTPKRQSMGTPYRSALDMSEKRYAILRAAYDELEHKYNELRVFDQGEQHYRQVQTRLPHIIETTAEILKIYDTLKKERTLGNAQQLWEQIQNFAPQAEQFLEDLISGKIECSPALRAKYASAHLARAGHGEITKAQVMHAQLTKDDVERIKLRSIEAIKTQAQLTNELDLPQAEYTTLENDFTNQESALLRRNLHAS